MFWGDSIQELLEALSRVLKGQGIVRGNNVHSFKKKKWRFARKGRVARDRKGFSHQENLGTWKKAESNCP